MEYRNTRRECPAVVLSRKSMAAPSEGSERFFAAIRGFAWQAKLCEYYRHYSADGSLIVHDQHS